jgi:hypothetical protein
MKNKALRIKMNKEFAHDVIKQGRHFTKRIKRLTIDDKE